jgi:molybdate transport system substrate-binding protein
MQVVKIMRTYSCVVAANTGFMLLLLGGTAAEAAELKVMSALGTMAVMEDLGPKFETASGHKLVFIFDGFTAIVKRVQAGETADVVIIPRQGIDGFVTEGKAAASSVTVIARSGISLAVRKGAPRPDISSPEALKRALLGAKSVSYPDPKIGGPTGIHFDKMLDRLGIRDDMRSKTVFPKTSGGAAIAGLVASGEAEIGAHLVQELLPVAGIEIVGPLPGDLQNTIVSAAVIMASAKDVEAAKAFIHFLCTPIAAAVIKAKGMEPATQ